MAHFIRILYLSLYVLCFLSAFAAYYCAVFLYKHGGELTEVIIWAAGGVVLTVIAFLLYRVYRKLAGR